jgi:hypothetical protein
VRLILLMIVLPLTALQGLFQMVMLPLIALLANLTRQLLEKLSEDRRSPSPLSTDTDIESRHS